MDEAELRKIVETELRRRRETDPLTYYTDDPMEGFVEEWTDPRTGETLRERFRLGPTPTAQACMRCLKPYRLLAGPNRSGKSSHNLAETAMYARGLHPYRPSRGPRWPDYRPIRMLVLVTTRIQAQTIWAERLLKRCDIRGPARAHALIPDWEIEEVKIEYSGTHKITRKIVLQNGSEVWFAWSGQKNAWQGIEGIAFDAIVRDESTGNENLLKEIYVRLLDAQGDKQLPYAGWFLWGATDTKMAQEFQDFQERCRSGNADHAEFVIGPNENPASDIEARRRMAESMSEEDAAVRLHGNADYRDRLAVFKPHMDPGRIQVPRPYIPQDHDNLWVALDPAFGRTGSQSAILFAWTRASAPREIHVSRVILRRNQTIADFARDIADEAQGRWIEAIVSDPAIKKAESNGRSVLSQFEEALKEHRVRIRRGIIMGRNRKDDTYPEMITYLHRDRYRFYEDPGCRALYKQMHGAVRKDETTYAGERGVVDKRLDAVAALRYLTSKRPTWVDRGPNPPDSAWRVTVRSHAVRDLVEAEDLPDDLDRSLQEHVEILRSSAARIERMLKRSPKKPGQGLRTVTYIR